MRLASLASIVLIVSAVTPASSALAPAQGAVKPIALACSGPAAATVRKTAVKAKLALALDPKACLAQASMYGGSSKQIVVAAPSPACGTRKSIQVYEQARSGSWGNLLETPVCGSSVAFGPNDQWGAIMITIDGRHYDQRGAYYVPVN